MNKFSKVFYPEAFNSIYIKRHLDFEDDLKDILKRSGHKDVFWGKFRQRLTFLENKREKCIQKRDWFEKLKQANNFYSMRFNKTQKNIRMIFTFIEYKNAKYAILLYPFEEKDNKNKSRFSYDTAIPIAQNRLKEVLGNG